MHLSKDNFQIRVPADPALRQALQAKLNRIAKPHGAFSFLSPVLHGLAQAMGSAQPHLKHPVLLLFSADHGIARHLPAEVGKQAAEEILQLLQGQSLRQVLNKECRLKLKVVDLGVRQSFESHWSYWLHHGSKLINAKMGAGSENSLQYPALTTAQCQEALNLGAKLCEREKHFGARYLAFAGLGGGGQIAALAVFSALSDQDPRRLTAGSEKWDGLNGAEAGQLAHRILNAHPKTHDPLTILTLFGGFELAALCGAILQAGEEGLFFALDGWPALVAFFLAQQLAPEIRAYAHLPAPGDYRIQREVEAELGLPSILNQPLGLADGQALLIALPLMRGVLNSLNNGEEDCKTA